MSPLLVHFVHVPAVIYDPLTYPFPSDTDKAALKLYIKNKAAQHSWHTWLA